MATEFKVVIDLPLTDKLKTEIESAIKSAVLSKIATLDLSKASKSDDLRISALRPNGGGPRGMVVRRQ
jgi:hypothetical protein